MFSGSSKKSCIELKILVTDDSGLEGLMIWKKPNEAEARRTWSTRIERGEERSITGIVGIRRGLKFGSAFVVGEGFWFGFGGLG